MSAAIVSLFLAVMGLALLLWGLHRAEVEQ